jgi:replicative superfamily II helicase/predicted nuclease of restriction endonuclease-like (RecB) superfamily
MKQFFETYRDHPKLSTLLRELPWSANLVILGQAKRPEEREFYVRTAIKQRWAVRELSRQIDGALFERAVLSPPKLSTALREVHPGAGQVFRDAYLVEFLELPDGHLEADLHKSLLANLQRFLVELGRDFCFMGSEVPLQVGGRDFALDLLFFHRGLNCLVAIELKIGAFEPEHLGKLEFYLEAQFINNDRRGIVLELLLTYLLTARERGIAPQLVALSAVIGGVNGFDNWLGCRSLVSTRRPVPLVEGVIDRNGVYHCVDASGAEQTIQLLPRDVIRQRKEKPEKQDVIVPLVRHLFQQRGDEKIIVFRNKRGSTTGCAAYLGKEIPLGGDVEAVQLLPQHDPSTVSQQLRTCFELGTAFHNTNLKPQEKQLTERSFRRRDGGVKVLVATTTVAAGVNTPASTVIIVEHEFVGDDARPYTVAEYKNMAGRAGRLGFSEDGRSILIADTSHEREHLFRQYVRGQLEPITSSFSDSDIATWFLRLLSQVREVREDEAIRLLANTYGGYLRNLKQPGWTGRAAEALSRLCAEMIDLGLLEREEEFIHLTPLGTACGRSGLSLRSAMRLVDQLRVDRSRGVNVDALMIAVQALPELDAIYTPCLKREPRWTSEAAIRFGARAAALQRHAVDDRVYHRRCKRALVVADWSDGVPTESIERNYTLNSYATFGYGDIVGAADATRFHMRSACSIASALFPDVVLEDEQLDELMLRLEMGLPRVALPLVRLHLGLARGECLALAAAGIRDATTLWSEKPEKLAQILGVARAEHVENLRPKAVA